MADLITILAHFAVWCAMAVPFCLVFAPWLARLNEPERTDE